MPAVATYDEASKKQNDCRPWKRFSYLLQSFASTRGRGKQPRKSEKNFMLGLFTTITCLTSQDLSFTWVSFLSIHSHKIHLKRGLTCKTNDHIYWLSFKAKQEVFQTRLSDGISPSSSYWDLSAQRWHSLRWRGQATLSNKTMGFATLQTTGM